MSDINQIKFDKVSNFEEKEKKTEIRKMARRCEAWIKMTKYHKIKEFKP